MADPSVQTTIRTFLALTVAVGGFGDGDRIVGEFHAAMVSIPGVSSIYNDLRRMPVTLIESFQEVKLAEFPREGTFVLGYLTGRPSAEVVAVGLALMWLSELGPE